MTSLKLKLSNFYLFSCIIFLSFTACTKKDDPAPSTTNNQSTGTTRFFKATIGSTAINYTENHRTVIGDVGANGITEGLDTWMVYNAAIVQPYQGIKNSLEMQIGNILVSDGTAKASEAQFNSFFSSGAKSYTTTTDEKTYNGVMLLWFDSDGEYWSTIGDQTGSTFTINKVTRTAATNTKDATVTIEASFNCTLYSTSLATKSVTNGKLKLIFQNMYKLD